MKRFLIHVSTYWCGMDDTFRAVAESEIEQGRSNIDSTSWVKVTVQE